MTRTRFFSILAVATALLLGSLGLAEAEQLKSKLGFYIDMPTGFTLVDGDGKTRFAFSDPNGGMEFYIFAYEPGRFADVEDLAKQSIGKLGSSGETTPFAYEGRKSMLAELGFTLNGVKQKGYALFMEGRKPTGSQAQAQAQEDSYALLSYAPESDFEKYSDFILSCLDSFSIDAAAERSPGPLSQFTLDWPPPRDKEKSVTLVDGSSAVLPWSEDEASQETDTDTREYKVLTAYSNEATLWQDAWARFYRMAYRESAARLDRLGLEMARLLPANDPTETARRVLRWVQGFVYQRDEAGIDFVPPLSAAYGARGDCDSRAVVAAILLKRLGIGAILMVSREYSHAMVGIDVPGGGQRFSFNGVDYLVGETTATVGIGMIAADMADWTKWLGIDLGN